MSLLPHVDESQIERRVGRRCLRRGRDYFLRGAVTNARRQGGVLKAACTGSSSTAYQVQVELNSRGIVGAGCTCPVGASGTCKHVAAVLFCWRERPHDFVEVEDLGTALGRCSRGELVELVKQIVTRYPDLEARLEGMLAGLGVRRTPPSLESYRYQAAALVRRAAESREGEARAAEQLTALGEIGDAFAQQHEFAAAGVVYRAIAAEVLAAAPAAGPFAHLYRVLDGCTAGLGRCLANLRDDPQARTDVLCALLEVYRFNVVARHETRDELPEWLTALADASEQLIVAEAIRQWLAVLEGCEVRRALGATLLHLERGRLDDDAVCEVCRRTGRTLDLARRLLGTGRVRQAVAEAEAADDYDLLRIADLVALCQCPAEAEQLVRRRAESAAEPAALRKWLARFRARQAHREASLRLAQKLFRVDPQMRTYLRLRQLGRQLGRWPELHPQLLASLDQAGHRHLLVRIHLAENDLDRALELVAAEESLSGDSSLALRVARAAERSRPGEAMAIYRRHAERLIADADADYYADACRYLRKVRALWTRAGGAAEWAAYIVALRQHYASQSALLRDLDAAEL